MDKHELKKAVNELAKLKMPGELDQEGKTVDVPSWEFQELSAGWWRYYAKRSDLAGQEQAEIIAAALEAKNAESFKEYTKKLPSEAVDKGRGIDHDLGKLKAEYVEEGGSNGSSTD